MAKLPNIACIYKITSPTGKVYIGQTRNVMLRFRSHKNFKWSRYKSALYNSLSKYGSNAHSFEIIHLLPNDIEQAVIDAYEQLYMDCYSDCNIHLLNSKEGGYKGAHSEEAKLKMSLKAKAHLVNNPQKVKEYARRLNEAKVKWQFENPDYIDDKISELKKGAKEWRESNPEAVRINIKRANDAAAALKTGVKRSMGDRRKISEGQFIPIIQLDKTGNFIKHWPSIKSAANALGIHNSTIVHHLKGKQKTAGGFTWRYK